MIASLREQWVSSQEPSYESLLVFTIILVTISLVRLRVTKGVGRANVEIGVRVGDGVFVLVGAAVGDGVFVLVGVDVGDGITNSEVDSNRGSWIVLHPPTKLTKRTKLKKKACFIIAIPSLYLDISQAD